MIKKFVAFASALAIAAMGLTACGGAQTEAKDPIAIGCMSSSEPIVQIVKTGLEKEGYTVDVKLFDQNNMPCTALKDGDINGVILNHKVWMETFNKENGSELVMAEPYIYYSPMRLYSAKCKAVEDLPEGATIAVPSDAANLDRSLRILEKVGLITLGGDKVNGFYSKINIDKNPKNIELIEAEITTAANSINDADAVISPAQYIAAEGTLDLNDYLYDDPESGEVYPLGLIVDKADADADWVKAALDYMQTDEAIKAFNDTYNGAYVLYNE